MWAGLDVRRGSEHTAEPERISVGAEASSPGWWNAPHRRAPATPPSPASTCAKTVLRNLRHVLANSGSCGLVLAKLAGPDDPNRAPSPSPTPTPTAMPTAALPATPLIPTGGRLSGCSGMATRPLTEESLRRYGPRIRCTSLGGSDREGSCPAGLQCSANGAAGRPSAVGDMSGYWLGGYLEQDSYGPSALTPTGRCRSLAKLRI